MVIVKLAKRKEQIDNPVLNIGDPRSEVRPQFAALPEPRKLELCVEGHNRAHFWQNVTQAAHKLGAGVGAAIGKKAVVVQLGILRPLDVQAELKGHLLIRRQPVEQRDRRAERLEIKVADWEFDSLEKPG